MLYHLKKIRMDKRVIRQLGMKSRHKLIVFTGRYDFSINFGKHLYAMMCMADIGCSDKRHRDCRSRKWSFSDETTRLSTIGIALHFNIHG